MCKLCEETKRNFSSYAYCPYCGKSYYDDFQQSDEGTPWSIDTVAKVIMMVFNPNIS